MNHSTRCRCKFHTRKDESRRVVRSIATCRGGKRDVSRWQKLPIAQLTNPPPNRRERDCIVSLPLIERKFPTKSDYQIVRLSPAFATIFPPLCYPTPIRHKYPYLPGFGAKPHIAVKGEPAQGGLPKAGLCFDVANICLAFPPFSLTKHRKNWQNVIPLCTKWLNCKPNVKQCEFLHGTTARHRWL